MRDQHPHLSFVILLLRSILIFTQECQPQCHAEHGVCINGACLCRNPWGGDDCGSRVVGISKLTSSPSLPQDLTSSQLVETQETPSFSEDMEQPSSQALEFEPVDSASQNILAASPLALPTRLLARPSLPSQPVKTGAHSAFATEVMASQAGMPAESRRSWRQHSMQEPPQEPVPTADPSSSDVPTESHTTRLVLRSQPVEAVAQPVFATEVVANERHVPAEIRRAWSQQSIQDWPQESFPTAELSSNNVPTMGHTTGLITLRKPSHSRSTFTVVSTAGEGGEPPSIDRFRKDSEHVEIARLRSASIMNHVKSDTSASDRKFNAVLASWISRVRKQKRTQSDTEICIYVPVGIQAGVFVLIIVFVLIDWLSRGHEAAEKVVRSSWTCGCCIFLSRWAVGAHFYTLLFGLAFFIIINVFWAYLCDSGLAKKYLEEVLFILFIAFVVLGSMMLLMVEMYLRYGKERVEQVRKLENNVKELVGLLQVKYGERLKRARDRVVSAGHNVGDKIDDVTDFVGITEASSDDDVTCWTACKRGSKVPNSKHKQMTSA